MRSSVGCFLSGQKLGIIFYYSLGVVDFVLCLQTECSPEIGLLSLCRGF